LQIVDAPQHVPGVCIACKGGTGRKNVDTLQKIGNWRVYVCVQCVERMANLCGFVKAQDLNLAIQENQELSDLVVRLNGELEAAKRQKVHVVPVTEVLGRVDAVSKTKLDGSPAAA
jgi:hypothetical protein